MLKFKSKNKANHFDVRCDESSSTDMSIATPVMPKKLSLFQVNKKRGFENTFDVNFEDTATNDTSDTTETCLKPKNDIFKRKSSTRNKPQQGSLADDSFPVGGNKNLQNVKASSSQEDNEERSASVNAEEKMADSLSGPSQDDSLISKSTPDNEKSVTPKRTEVNIPFGRKQFKESSFSVAYDDTSVRSELSDSPVSSQEPNSSFSLRMSSRIFGRSASTRVERGPFKRSMKRSRKTDSNIEYNIDEVQSLQESDHVSTQADESDFKKPKLFGNTRSRRSKEFDDDMLTPSQVLTQEAQVSSQESELSFTRVASSQPFESRARDRLATFNMTNDITTPASQESQYSSQESEVFKKPFAKPKKTVKNIFDVDFEESTQASQTTSRASSHYLEEPLTQEIVTLKDEDSFTQQGNKTLECEEPQSSQEVDDGLFDRKTDITVPVPDLKNEVASSQGSSQSLTQGSSQSQESQDVSKQVRKPSGFGGRGKNVKPARFEIDFDESGNVTTLTQRSDLKTSTPIFRKSKKSKISDSDFCVNYEETQKVNRSVFTPASRANETCASQFSSDMENLDGWMSEQSDEGEEEEEAVKEGARDGIEKNESGKKESQITKKTVEKSVIVTDEDRERWNAKVREIVDNAVKSVGSKAQSEMVEFKELYNKKNPQPGKRQPLKSRQVSEAVEKKRPVRRWKKPAPFVTKRFYDYVLRNLRERYGLDAVLRTEELILNLCEVVKIVERRKEYQKKLVNELKMDLARSGLIETTYDFYDFVREYLPDSFRSKVIPCVQPGTGITFPPKDGKNPLDKILD